MILIDRAEAMEWLTRAGLPANPQQHTWEMTYSLPDDAGLKLNLDRGIAEIFRGSPTLFASTEIGVWASSGNEFVFNRFLSSGTTNGAPEPGADVFLLVGPDENEYLEGAVLLSLLFIYGGFVAAEAGRLIGWSHDEFVFALSNEEEKLGELTALFTDIGLTPDGIKIS